MTKSEFVNRYCERSNITKDSFYEWMVPMPCACGEDGCAGWAAIRLNAIGIEGHLAFCAPEEIRRYYAE